MLLSAVSVLVVAQSSSEIPEGLMNNSVYKTVLSPNHAACPTPTFLYFINLVNISLRRIKIEMASNSHM